MFVPVSDEFSKLQNYWNLYQLHNTSKHIGLSEQLQESAGWSAFVAVFAELLMQIQIPKFPFKSNHNIYIFSADSYRWKCKERNCKYREAGCYNLSHPCLGNSVSIADGGHSNLDQNTYTLTLNCHVISHHSPPEGICIAVEVSFPTRPYGILLTKIHEVAGKNPPKESNV